MLKKSIFFVILSGLITSGAVLGWSKTSSEQVNLKQDETQAEVRTVKADVHKSVIDSFNANNDIANALKTVSDDDRVKKLFKPSFDNKMRLVSPDTPPMLIEQKLEVDAPKTSDALDVMLENEVVKNAETSALIDIAGNRVVESSNVEKTSDFPALLANTAGEADYLFHAEDTGIKKLYWHCLDGGRNHCLAADVPVKFSIPESSLCDAAVSEFVFCSQKSVELFGNNCTDDDKAEAAAIRDMLAKQDAEQGSFEIKGHSDNAPKRKFNFESTSVHGCVVYSVKEDLVEKDASVQENASESMFTPAAMGGAAAAGILMILLGLFCVRRKDNAIAANDDNNKLDQDNSDYNGKEKNSDRCKTNDELRKECELVKTERDAALSEKKDMSKIISKLETEVSEAEERNHQLNSQLDYARSQYKQEQIQRISLAEDNRRLEEELTQSKTSLLPVKDDKQNKDDGDDGKVDANRITAPLDAHNIVEDEKNPDNNQEQSNNRVTVQTEKNNIEQLSAGTTSDFFESLTDEGWNEIEDSFDALFAPKSTSLSSMIKDDVLSDADESGGFSGFFEAVKENQKRDETVVGRRHIDTETLIKPVSSSPEKNVESTLNKGVLPTLRSVTPVKASVPGLKTSTLNGFYAGKKLFEDKKTSDENKLDKKLLEDKKTSDENKLDKKLSDDKKTSDGLEKIESKFALGGKKLNAPNKGIDETSLLNALKRRVKDVSELDVKSAENPSAKSSGSFDYAHGLSKSGVFSVTGSRVDIDPFSDKEQFKAVYENYIVELKKAGEPTDRFTMEQFVSKLARQKNELIKKGGYKSVTFSVVVKDGKPGINAVTQK